MPGCPGDGGRGQGYSLMIVMPENAPSERKRLLTRFGADLRLTPSTEAMPGAIASQRPWSARTPPT